MKKLPLGIQTFSKLIENDYLYIDKTKLIFDLIASGSNYYFLSRPRRFGKSLLLSTLKEIFAGNRNLFRDLWIYDQIPWQKHPVIHMDFSVITHSKDPTNFEKNINYFLDKTAEEYGLLLEAVENKEKLLELTKRLHDQFGPVVILIDEYDKPIVDHLENIAKADENKAVLASFYEVIKYMDKYLKFVLITGVSKFSKVSIFSKLNNLKDITLLPEYNTLCGYTQAELEASFSEYVEILAHKEATQKAALLAKIKKWYNGYSWFDGQSTVYNPFGILNLFDSKLFRNYWFQTATPTFLLNLIKEQKVQVADFDGYKAGEAVFESFDLEKIHPAALLFQTGYLTIKKYRNRRYTLSYPNFEVKESFLIHLLATFSGLPAPDTEPLYLDMLDYLAEENIPRFTKCLIALFAGIPAILHLEFEAYYQSLFYLVLALLGAEIILEENTDKGRIDGVLELENQIYLIEFKLDQADTALQQIKTKRYYEKYLKDSRKIILLGVGGFRQKEITVRSEVAESCHK